MTDLNKVMLIGHLGGKPEMRKTANGTAVCQLRLATSHAVAKDGGWERDTLWHNVTVFDKLAERCCEYLDKGRLVYVEGTLRANEWTDKQGVVHDGRDIRANNVSFLGGPGGKGEVTAQQAQI